MIGVIPLWNVNSCFIFHPLEFEKVFKNFSSTHVPPLQSENIRDSFLLISENFSIQSQKELKQNIKIAGFNILLLVGWNARPNTSLLSVAAYMMVLVYKYQILLQICSNPVVTGLKWSDAEPKLFWFLVKEYFSIRK